MSTQKKIGVLFSIFCGLVLVAHVVQRLSRGEPLFDLEELYYYGFFLLFLASALKDSIGLKWGQVLCFLIAGVYTMTGSGNLYVGLTILSAAFFLAAVYGAFDKNPRFKVTVWASAYFLTFLFANQTGDSGVSPDQPFVSTLVTRSLWFSFVVVHCLFYYILGKDTLDKAKKVDELEKIVLREKLVEAVKAGKVVMDELRRKEGRRNASTK